MAVRPANVDSSTLLLGIFSFGLFLFLMLTALLPGYGYFIDELYYIACSKRLAFGYIDHPPGSIVLLALSRWLFGDSIPAMRIFPSLAAAANVFIAGKITQRLAGGRTAVAITSLAVIAMPVYLLMGSFWSMNAYEPLIWTAIAYCVIRLVQEENPKLWVAIGALAGIGLEMKHTMVVYGIALVVGLCLTSARRYLWNRWVLWGLLFCALLVLPNLVWQVIHGFPSLEFYRNAMLNKNVPRGALGVILDQVLFTNPLVCLVWLGGLWYFFFVREGANYRFFGWTYLILLVVMIASRSSRPDRIGAMYTVLFAAGAVELEGIAQPAVRRLMAGVAISALACGAILAAPVATPLLPPPVLKSYLSALGFSYDLERGKAGEPVPQWLADRLGWKELATDVAQVYHELPPEEQRNAVIVSTSYGEAGALELYGPEFGLPPVFCTHNSYHLWGPPSDSVKTYIGVFVSRRDIENRFERVVEAAVHTCEDCTRPQRSIPIYVARNPKFSIEKEWGSFKMYD